MTDAVEVALITSFTTVASIAVSRWFSHREHARTANEVKSTKREVEVVKLEINGRLSEFLKAKEELMAVAVELAEAKGVTKEKARQKLQESTFEAGKISERETR
jgi:hypothetical protein